ncbi:MAG: hypothetical protein AB2814_09415 [Candidatus Sedimenticola endophacoides]
MRELHDLELILRSDTPIITIESLEETRVLHLLTQLALRLGEPMFRWSVTEGLSRLEDDFGPQKLTREPPEVLRHIKATPRAGVYVLLDFHPYLADPLHTRLIKEIAQGYETTPRTLVLISHAIEIPPEIRHLSASFRLSLPDRAGIRRLIREEAEGWQRRHGRKIQLNR